MGMSAAYGAADEKESIATLHRFQLLTAGGKKGPADGGGLVGLGIHIINFGAVAGGQNGAC